MTLKARGVYLMHVGIFNVNRYYYQLATYYNGQLLWQSP